MKEDELIACLRELKKERAKLRKHSDKSADFSLTPKARANANESARESAVEVRRLEHEGHCLAVELGIADMRDDAHYGDTVAPAGFGREYKVTRRRPELS